MTSLFPALRSVGAIALEYLLDTIAPPDPIVRSIEKMEASQFASAASSTLDTDAPKGVLALFSYKDPLVKTAILEVKSRGNRKLAQLLGKASRDLLVEELSELEVWKNFSAPILVPVPLTGKSLRRRGWNQCELIAFEIALSDRGVSFELRTDVLIKIRETADQVGKTRSERFANLKNCFAVKNPDAVKGRNVIVFDDIVTTGATLGEAKRALLKSGAKRTLCLALAH